MCGGTACSGDCAWLSGILPLMLQYQVRAAHCCHDFSQPWLTPSPQTSTRPVGARILLAGWGKGVCYFHGISHNFWHHSMKASAKQELFTIFSMSNEGRRGMHRFLFFFLSVSIFSPPSPASSDKNITIQIIKPLWPGILWTRYLCKRSLLGHRNSSATFPQPSPLTAAFGEA